MKVYEVLASSRFLLATMNRNGVSADDIMYLDMCSMSIEICLQKDEKKPKFGTFFQTSISYQPQQ